MKRYLLGIFCVLAVWATSTGVSQTVRSLGYNVSNNTILWTNTNGITFPQRIRLTNQFESWFDASTKTNWLPEETQYAGRIRGMSSTTNAYGLLVGTPFSKDPTGIILHAVSESDTLQTTNDGFQSRFIVRSDGKVGVNVVDPSSTLHVAGNTRVSGDFLLTDESTIKNVNLTEATWGVQPNPNWGPKAFLNDTKVRELDVYHNTRINGRLTIGDPAWDTSQFNVTANANVPAGFYAGRVYNGRSTDSRGLLVNLFSQNSNSTILHLVSGTDPFYESGVNTGIYINPNSRFIVRGDGKVGIGTEYPSEMLTVAGTISALRISNSGRSINFLTGTIDGFTGLGSGNAITASNITVSSFAPNGGLLIGSTATGQLYTHTNLGVITTSTYVIGNTGTNLTNWTTESMPERIGAQSATRWFNIAAVTNTTNFLPRHRYLSCYYNLWGATGTNTLVLPTNNVVTGDIIGVYPYYANADGTNVAIRIVSYTRQFVTTPFTGWDWTTNLVTNTVRRSPNSSDISYFQFAEGSGWNQVEPQLVRNDTEVPVINVKASGTIRTNLDLGATNNVLFGSVSVSDPGQSNNVSLRIGNGGNTGFYTGGISSGRLTAAYNGNPVWMADGSPIIGFGVYSPISFQGDNATTNAAVTRSNLGLPLSTLTNTSNVTMMRALAGVTNGPVSDSITLSDGSSNWTLTFSNGILVSITEL